MYVYSILISLYISLMDVNDIWGIKIDQSDYILNMVIDILNTDVSTGIIYITANKKHY